MKNYLNSLELLATNSAEISQISAQKAFLDACLPSKKNEHWRFSNIDFWQAKALELTQENFDETLASKLNENEFARQAFYALISGEKFDTCLAKNFTDINVLYVKANEHQKISACPSSKINIYILEEGAKLDLKCQKFFDNSELSLSASFFYLAKNATLNNATIYDCIGNSPRYTRADFYLQDGATLNDVFVEKGSSNTRSERNTFILGEHANAQLSALIMSDASNVHDLRTSQINIAPSSHSNLIVKNLLGGTARSAFTGLIRVGELAQKTESYQSCKSLLMSEKARAQAIPILEILANDVVCSHGCTVSRPDREQIFYMKSRGLNDKLAQKLIAEGFADEILSKIIEP